MKTLPNKKGLVTLIFPRLLLKKTSHWLLIGVLFGNLSACENSQQSSDLNGDNSVSEEETIQERLILENATLNQVDSQGNTLWKLEVTRVVYRQNEQNAELEEVRGELYEEGEVFLEVEAKEGKIINDGKKINLEGNIVATDPRNGAVLRSDKIEWSPEERLLVIPQPLEGEHPRFNVVADEGKYYTDREELELIGKVKGNATDPPLQLQGKQLNWFIPQEIVKSEQPLEVKRFHPEKETIRDRVTANSGEVNLGEKIVLLEKDVNFQSNDPPVKATSDHLRWEIDKQLITSNQPLQVVQTEDNLTLRGNQGEINLDSEIAQFQGDVKGISTSNQGKLYANRLRWNLPTQEINARGDVTYEQSDPLLITKGDEASGVLQKENIVVKGTQEEQVTTELVP